MAQLYHDLAIIQNALETTQPVLFKYLVDYMEKDMLYLLLSSYMFSIFIRDIASVNPEVLVSIFDSYLLMGKAVTFSIVFSCFEKMKDTILAMPEEKLMNYLKSQMVVDLIEEHPIHSFLELNEGPRYQ